jgi:predicted TIM-barrel fold metal-dependent hydrolase
MISMRRLRRAGQMRIDACVHYTPPSMYEDIEIHYEREPYTGLMMAPDPLNPTKQGWATPERMIEDMDKAGIDKVVLQGEPMRRHESCVARNDQGLGIMKRWPERVLGFAMVQPKAGQKALDELKRCVDGGMQGIGEACPYGQGYSMEDPDFLLVVEACIDHNIPLWLHLSEDVGHYYHGKSTLPLRDVYRLVCRYPELSIVLAHWGAGFLFHELMPEVRQALKNTWYGMNGSPILFPTEAIFRVALACVDHRKIIYSSDYPCLLYPDQSEPDFRLFIAEIEALRLSPEVFEDIMGHNAARLLGLIDSHEETTDKAVGKPELLPDQVITDIPDKVGIAVDRSMAVSAVAEAWPETREVFERYGIPWEDSPVPFWEPIAQAAAARGYGPQAQDRLLAELNEAIS